MKRREFISLLGGAAATPSLLWPPAARAQQGKLPTIGFLGTASPAAWAAWTPAFVQRLRELGWIEGRTVAIEYRFAEARPERFAEIAAEFVRLKVDVILTGGASVLAVKQATSVIPIVFAVARDPLGEGLVTSLARPGGNATGLSLQIADLAGKRLEVLREILPGVRKLAVLLDVGDPASARNGARSNQQPGRWASRSSPLKSGGPTRSDRPSKRARRARMRFMFAPASSSTSTGIAFSRGRSTCVCRR